MNGPAPRTLPPLVDSHAHLDMKDFDHDRDQVVERALGGGLAGILCPADVTDARSLEVTLDLSARYPLLAAAAGVHPHQASSFRPEHLAEVGRLAAAGAIRAVGEVGLDFHYDLSPREAQRTALRAQARLARDLGLPLIVHTRSAGQEAADILEQESFRGQGVLHCYTEDWPLAERMLDRGFFISFSGILTFPRADGLREVARRVPAHRLLVETDSPFLAPVPHRGRVKRNEPRFVVDTARVLAGLQAVSLERLAEVTTGNYRALFFDK